MLFYVSLYDSLNSSVFLSFLIIPPPPSSTLFPYTTLFRSQRSCNAAQHVDQEEVPATQPALEAGTEKEQSEDRKSTRLNSSHLVISYAVFCLKKKIEKDTPSKMQNFTIRRTTRQKERKK